ncbi:MAG: hypothetical protein MHMPM18_001985, partial [Marteilia pararefringens]
HTFEEIANFTHQKQLRKWKATSTVYDSFYFCGKPKTLQFTDGEKSLLSNRLIGTTSMLQFNRAVFRGQRISTYDYDKNKVSYNSGFLSSDFHFFLKIKKLCHILYDSENSLEIILAEKYYVETSYSNLLSITEGFEIIYLDFFEFFSKYSPVVSCKNYIIAIIDAESF